MLSRVLFILPLIGLALLGQKMVASGDPGFKSTFAGGPKTLLTPTEEAISLWDPKGPLDLA